MTVLNSFICNRRQLCCFAHILQEYPWRRHAWRRVYVFQDCSNAHPYLQHILKVCKCMPSKWPQIRVFKEPSFSQGHKMPTLGRIPESTLYPPPSTRSRAEEGGCGRHWTLTYMSIQDYFYQQLWGLSGINSGLPGTCTIRSYSGLFETIF